MPIRSSMVRQSVGKVWFRFLACVAMAGGLCWQLGAAPVQAQSLAEEPPTWTGEFLSQGELYQGNYTLRRTGPTISIMISATRTQMQGQGQWESPILFTIPLAFRPARPVLWEGAARPVRANRTAFGEMSRRFRLQVEPDGTVRHLQDVGVDDTAYLQYTVAMAWPTGGSEPHVCSRPFWVRAAILASLQASPEAASPDCQRVTWEDLASIRHLQLSQPQTGTGQFEFLRRELAGLTGLEFLQLDLRTASTLSGNWLAHTPRLTKFVLEAPKLRKLHPDLLQTVPLLRSLELEVPAATLPQGLLSHVPHLTSLSLTNDGHTLASNFLAANPRLQTLSLVVPHLTEWPAGLLVPTPLLTTLHLQGGWSSLPADLLEQLPVLTHLALETPHMTVWPQGLLAAAPQLTSLQMTGPWEVLPHGLLECAPLLTHFALATPQLEALPPDLLAYAPSLNSLELRVPGVFQIPTDLLTYSPGLERLTVETFRLKSWPSALLEPIPLLTYLSLDAPGLSTLPGDWLAPVPRLDTLVLEGSWNPLPARLLAGAPRLRSLKLSVFCWTQAASPCAREVPEDFLGPTPQLTSLSLDLPGIQNLPLDFLASAPSLSHLNLYAPHLQALPDAFLTGAPSLQQLTLFLSCPNEQEDVCSTDFLTYLPHLTTLSLTLKHGFFFPEGYMARAPSLRELELRIRGRCNYPGELGHCNVSLPASFLSEAPRLTTFKLESTQVVPWPDTFLSQPLPQLTTVNVTLNLPDSGQIVPWTLSEEFLAQAPKLRHLDFELPYYVQLPEGFLAQGQSQLTSVAWTGTNWPHSGTIEQGFPHLGTLPDHFLDQAPQLSRLDLNLPLLTVLPSDFLDQAPQLSHLDLNLPQLTALPSGFLSQVPRLSRLNLFLPQLTILPSNFLIQAPQLSHLNLFLPQLTVLPSDFLAEAPQLSHLYLNLPQPTALPSGFLSQVPQLYRLNLLLPQLRSLPADFLTQVPSLARFSLEVSQLHSWPTGFLESAPELNYLGLTLSGEMWPSGTSDFLLHLPPSITRLKLSLNQLESLPHDFQAYAPLLESLNLHAWSLKELPDNFLVEMPRLTNLSMYAHRLTKLPDTFLTRMPELTHLALLVDDLTALPSNFLVETPRLTNLSMYAHRLTKLPDTFLTRMPELTHLALGVYELTALPSNFLIESPRLTNLIIHAPSLTKLPDTFLDFAPRLSQLWLDISSHRADVDPNQGFVLPQGVATVMAQLESLYLTIETLRFLPDDFLAHTPYLASLTWRPCSVDSEPANFLAYAPQLHTLHLYSFRRTNLGSTLDELSGVRVDALGWVNHDFPSGYHSGQSYFFGC